jgi:lysophospholipase L1-like esterase
LSKRTEAFVGTTRFHGFSVQNGALVPSPFPFAHSIEFIGDSITCGYGVETNRPDCDFSPDQESEWSAWGAVASRALGAAHTSVCYSGKGVVRNSGGGTNDLISAIFQRTLGDTPEPKWDFARFQPEVVVINLGTNDYSVGDPGQAFVDGYHALLTQVREKYPKAWIVCAIGSMLGPEECKTLGGYVNTAIARTKDQRISYLDLGTQDPKDGIGCNFHPNVVTQQKMANMLVAHIKQKAGF